MISKLFKYGLLIITLKILVNKTQIIISYVSSCEKKKKKMCPNLLKKDKNESKFRSNFMLLSHCKTFRWN